MGLPTLLKHVRHSQFIRHNTILLLGSVMVGALNYLYYPIMGRLLEPASFGEVQTLVSLFLQLTIFLSVFGLVTVNIVANYQDDSSRNAVILAFEKLALSISLGLLIITVVLQAPLADFFHFDSALPFVILMSSLLFAVPFTFRSAFLRGRQKFGLYTVVNLLGAGGKLLLSPLLIVLGLGTAGAIGGLVTAQALACALAVFFALRLGLKRPKGSSPLGAKGMKAIIPELRYGLLVLTGSLVITMQYSVDIMVIKHYFDAETAGLYAGIASVARIIFFLTASVAMVLMSSVTMQQAAPKNRSQLIKSFALLSVLGLPPLGLFALAPKFIITMLMGPQYLALAELLPPLSLTIFIVSALNLLIAYYLSLRRYGVAPVVLAGALITYVFILLHHGTPAAVVYDLLWGSVLMLGAFGAWITITHIRGRYAGSAAAADINHYSGA
ncbi:MAG TPA: oligosaccharide flippase family protein [Candidatus Saccharimonadales bacterium]|nr:oligosaccharide flippase family protein [Candidatus Saccharimonadales bacterium]